MPGADDLKPVTATVSAPPAYLQRTLYLLFMGSGFAGLIYESVWSHYLKLVLGHAAYAQTLVLAIFMGGMALGAWLVSRYSALTRRALTTYALVELLIALFGFVFHPLFVATSYQLLHAWLPALGTPSLIMLCKWSVCGALILPQAILLGTTFPLLSIAVMRVAPAHSGKTLASLYFTNSFGAVLGALASAFVLIPSAGLPGTILVAATINALIAASVWLLARLHERAAEAASSTSAAAQLDVTSSDTDQRTHSLFVLGALLTGVASFFYELAWVRMLSMVLGSTVQAFELMLSAFITGLAFGSLFIRRRIERIAQPVRFSGYVQVLMGVLAVLTLVEYDRTFDVMAYLVSTLPKTDAGYLQFNLSSAALALAVMLPTTLVAGTTLPLFTHVLLRAGHGEPSVGRVYAANTLGAILGVLMAVHIVMPMFGVKWVIGAGALIDAGLGFWLLASRAAGVSKRRLGMLCAAVSGVFAIVLIGTQPSPERMAAGVFRTGKASINADVRVVFHRDGKTASIDALRAGDGTVGIVTNGKPDATANPNPTLDVTDEPTMVLAAAVPLTYVPNARSVANIGFGSGMTTHALLGASSIERVDTLEIEPAMVEGAHIFGKLSERAYLDPRSHIYFDDAKSFLSSHVTQYDVIISEPSNPWVSGVANLFSRELYRDIKRHIRPGGVLVQWSQLYETDLDNLASVFKALGEQFRDYAVYNTVDFDLLIVASPDRPLGQPSAWLFEQQPALTAQLARVGVKNLADLEARRIGDRHSLEALFLGSSAPANSDFFPYLSYRAPRTRFLGSRADLAELHRTAVPVIELLDGHARAQAERWTETPFFIATGLQRIAFWLHDALTGQASREGKPRLPRLVNDAVTLLAATPTRCDELVSREPQLQAALHQLVSLTGSLLTPQQGRELWHALAHKPCFEQHSPGFRAWFALYEAIATHDARAMASSADAALRITDARLPTFYLELALTAGVTGALIAQGPQEALAFFEHAHRDYVIDAQTPLELRLVLLTAAHRAGKL